MLKILCNLAFLYYIANIILSSVWYLCVIRVSYVMSFVIAQMLPVMNQWESWNDPEYVVVSQVITWNYLKVTIVFSVGKKSCWFLSTSLGVEIHRLPEVEI